MSIFLKLISGLSVRLGLSVVKGAEGGGKYLVNTVVKNNITFVTNIMNRTLAATSYGCKFYSTVYTVCSITKLKHFS